MQPENRPSTSRYRSHAGVLTIVGLALAVFTGCYDDDALVQAARTSAATNRLAEVDLGTFQTTLPRDPQTHTFTELKLHVFGTVPRYRQSDVTKQLKAEDYRVQAATLGAVRAASRDELAEPSLAKLRARIERVMNEVLADKPVKSVGFYEVSLRQQ